MIRDNKYVGFYQQWVSESVWLCVFVRVSPCYSVCVCVLPGYFTEHCVCTVFSSEMWINWQNHLLSQLKLLSNITCPCIVFVSHCLWHFAASAPCYCGHIFRQTSIQSFIYCNYKNNASCRQTLNWPYLQMLMHYNFLFKLFSFILLLWCVPKSRELSAWWTLIYSKLYKFSNSSNFVIRLNNHELQKITEIICKGSVQELLYCILMKWKVTVKCINIWRKVHFLFVFAANLLCLCIHTHDLILYIYSI